MVNTGSEATLRHVLAIDLGSGSIKAAVVSETGRVIACAAAPVATRLLENGGAEQDPRAWWEDALETARRAVRDSDVPPDAIVAVACDSQWSVVVPVDKNAEPLMPAVHWLDTRGAPYNRKITAGFPRVKGYGLAKVLKWIRRTGLAPTHSGVDSLGHLLFIKNERPEIYRQTHKFLEPMDYLTARLTGRITATQKTMAPFMVSENRTWGTRDYSPALLAMAGLDAGKFPELIENDGIVGPLSPAVAKTLGLRPETPVIAGIGDSNASAIGSGAVRDFETILYIGTSFYMTAHVPFQKTDILHMMTSLPSPFPNRYYLLGEQGAGGKCLDFFMNALLYADDAFVTGDRPEDAYRRFTAVAAEAPAGSGGLIFLPWLNGSIVPDEDPHVRGGFMNLSFNTERRHMARSIMEGLAFNNRWTREAAESFFGRKIESFRFSGGGAQSDLWAQIHADVLGVPIHQVDDPVNSSVRGAALLAFVILSHLKIENIPDLVPIRRTFHPDPANREVYDKLYRQYRALFKRNRKIFKALNGTP